MALVVPSSTDGWQQVSSPSKSPLVRTPSSGWSPTSTSGWTSALGRNDPTRDAPNTNRPQQAGHSQVLCLFLCRLTEQDLPAPGTPNTSYMQVVSPRIREAHPYGGKCGGKFGFSPQTCLKRSHASAFWTTQNDSLSVPIHSRICQPPSNGDPEYRRRASSGSRR